MKLSFFVNRQPEMLHSGALTTMLTPGLQGPLMDHAVSTIRDQAIKVNTKLCEV